VIDTYTKTTPTTNAGWLQLMAVRLAVVARSAEYEKDIVTGNAPTWAVPMLNSDSGTSPLPLKLSQLGSDWNHYRYKVYDTVVPLRNAMWNS
jgi:type IV pilus assembly protein PilW